MNNYPKIIENHIDPDVDARSIIERIIKYAPEDALHELNEIVLFDTNQNDDCFACYRRGEKSIELYLGDIIGWLPWILKRSYVVPYLFVGIALGHELDHHVNRYNVNIDREISAETNALKYIYPSFGPFKPIAKLASLLVPQPKMANKSLENDVNR